MHQTVAFLSQGEPIAGTLTLPADVAAGVAAGVVAGEQRGPFPAILLLHGYTAHRNEGFAPLAAALTQAGFATLRIDMRGSGESAGAKGRILPGAEWVADARSALSFLAGSSGIDPARLGVVGVSLGGGVALQLGAEDDRVNCVVAMAPVTDGEDFLRAAWLNYRDEQAWRAFLAQVAAERARAEGTDEQLRPLWDVLPLPDQATIDAFVAARRADPLLVTEVTLSSAADLMQFKPLAAGARIAIPVLLLHDPADPIVPYHQSEHMADALTGITCLEPVPGGGHNLILGEELAFAIEHTVVWCQQYLAP